jgi:uncharacterized membrane protein (DUF485 family)
VRQYNSRLGLALFGVYLVLYGGFVMINAFAPTAMEATPLAGVNVAIWYGLGLIFAALALALLHGVLCKTGDDRAGDGERDKTPASRKGQP